MAEAAEEIHANSELRAVEYLAGEL